MQFVSTDCSIFSQYESLLRKSLHNHTNIHFIRS